jgi:hypothetical protein
MSKERQVPQNEGVPATVGAPSMPNQKSPEEDGENKLLGEGGVMDRERLMGNE